MAGNFQRAFRAVIIFTVLFCAAKPSLAQDCCSRGETFAGYSFLSADANTDGIVSPQFDSRYSMSRSGYGVPVNGFNQAINLSRKLALVVDFSHNAKELTINDLALGQTPFAAAETKISTNLFLFGARLNSRGEGSNFFGQAMIGGFNRKVEAKDVTLGSSVKLSNTDLAFALGGGADMAVAKNVAIRIFQVDYILARGTADSPPGENRLSNNFRFQIGVVFRWGHLD
jgi:opacity protein-like surface antigen